MCRSCRRPTSLLVETFPRGAQNYLVCYPFEGRLAHQTLGMLLTRRLERARARRSASSPPTTRSPSGGSAIFGAADPHRRGCRSTTCSTRTCWATISRPGSTNPALMKRTFRNCAIIAGLIERRHPGKEKTGRQITVSTDIIYDVLYQHEPDHILIQATRRDAARGLLDIGGSARCCPRSGNISCTSRSTESRLWRYRRRNRRTFPARTDRGRHSIRPRTDRRRGHRRDRRPSSSERRHRGARRPDEAQGVRFM
jgi:Lhr-like helicase